MRHTSSPTLRGLAVGAAALTFGLLGQAGCNSEAEPLVDVAGSAGRAGSASTPSGGGSGATQGGNGNPTNGAGSNAAGASGQPTAAAGAGGTASTAGSTGAAGAATAGNSSGGVSGSASAGTGGSAGAGTGGSTGDGTKPVKVWLAGDSTMQNCSGACPCGWGSQFDALFNDNVTVVNSAVGGRSIQTWLYEASVSSTLGQDGECTLTSQSYDKRWTAMLDATTGMKAGDYLLIQFGINDSDSQCPKHVGTPRFKTLLTTMAQAAKERGAQPLFVTPVSAIICSGNTAQPTRGRFVTATEEAAAAAGVPLLDLHQLSIDLYNQLGFCPNDENYGAGKVGSFFCQDHTHFEASGAKQIASLVAGALNGAAPTLAKYRK